MSYELLICENIKEQGILLSSLIESYELDLEIKLFIDSDSLISYLMNGSSKCIILMDIMLDDGKNGIEIVKFIHKLQPDIPVIFISAYLELACDVYDVEHCYFVYKQQKDKKLLKALIKAIDILNKKPLKILLHEGQNLISLDIKEILCIERIRRATFITTSKKVYQVQESLKDLKEVLPEFFVQCHRNYMVNFFHVRRLKPSELELNNGVKVPVSRRFSTSVSNSFQSWLANSGDEIL